VLKGIGVSPGRGSGVVRRLAAAEQVPLDDRLGGDAGEELRRAEAAIAQTAADLDDRAERARGTAAEILAAQALMVRDPVLFENISGHIGTGTAAARAVHDAFGAFREMLAGAGEYLAARAADLDDLRDRVLAALLGRPAAGLSVASGGQPVVVVAQDLAPADTALLDPDIVAGFITREGGPTSHTAILARALGIPAVVACRDADWLADDTTVVVDGDAGTVLVDPPEAEVARVRAAAGRSRASSPSGPGRTADGRPVVLAANIGHPRDLAAAKAACAEGIGLYRTEFLFFDRTDEPGEDEQQAAYQQALEAFPDATVIIRVLDVGADKPLRFMPPASAEPNPALGERGLRLLRRHQAILDGQLRALARAAAAAETGRLGVMAPMVADLEETRWFAGRCQENGIALAGVMVEVPSAALRAADLASEVGFFSVGTNDLAQYAFAAERQSAALAHLQDPWQPALLDLIAAAATAAAAAGKPCGVCGESAADPVLACVLTGLGVTSLSMTPRALPRVRAALASATWAECEAAAAAARAARTAHAARAAARAALPGLTHP
jgi:phosphotransferase system enzyme I (PtsI)